MNGSMLAVELAESADREDFRREVLAGLSCTPRSIPPKFLYDARGSALFDAICELPEYYLTRTETEILKRHAADIASRAGPRPVLIEFGSGSSVKSRLLLAALQDVALYSPIDISRHHLDQTAAVLRRDYPSLRIEPVCADYMALDAVPRLAGEGRRLGFFPARPSVTSRPPRRPPSCAAPAACSATTARSCLAPILRRIRGGCTMPTTIQRESPRPSRSTCCDA